MSSGTTSADGESGAAAGRGRRPRLGWLKYVFVVAVLAFVATRVPWKDQLVWTEPTAGSIEGEIEGDWKQDEVVFHPTVELPASTPAELRSALESGASLRRVEGLEWQPGIPRVFREVRPEGLLTALGLIVAGVFITATRWWLLLAAADVRPRWYDAVRLTCLGLFFNLVVPGLTGGDLIKAVLVAKENPGKRTAAVVSVFVDRLVGLFTLLAMGAAVILTVGGEFAEVRTTVLVLLVVGVAGAVVYTSAPLRRLVRFDAIVARLPMGSALARLDEAVLIYSRHKLLLLFSFAVSVVNHMMIIVAIMALGRAFGDQVLGLVEYVIVVSVGNTASALPVAPGGWGVGEAIYGYLYTRLGAGAALGVATSVGYRLVNMAIGLASGVFLLLPGARAERARIDQLRHGAS